MRDGGGQRVLVRELLDRYGRTYAEECGIRLRNTPQPLYQLLVLADLLSTRIRASVAVAAARALFDAGMGTPRRMLDATWQQRVDALGEGGYRRYDESTATRLGDGAALLLDTYGGDLRRMREAADGEARALSRALQEMPGVGPTGAAIFLREVQGVWTEFAPLLDPKAVQGAERLGLPRDGAKLAGLIEEGEAAAFASALVRAALDRRIAEEVREAAAG
ncbi:endonuclease [Streptomyces gilvosporeus]|uniref:Endonuclease n=1 Tax=Streptomyces gilvosporeus TaxID=553510 RepID=A0A1V0U239_9ACTN|nr:endonuclease [Streptomyces gilvosporeus]ARF59295.1 endonuclease [Streptomyces gilvosporeus]